MTTNSVNARDAHLVHALGLLAGTLYLALAAAGDLRQRPGWALAAHGALVGVMLAAWWLVRRHGTGPAARGMMRSVLVAALAFRLLAAWGGPVLSDDVYRYLWDGRVQLHGVHPYRYAPDDPALAGLRDADWEHVNHPELRTIYPPLAQGLFALLAWTGGGALSFQVGMGLLDFGVVLALVALLRRRRLPAHRAVLYAWNPLAVVETAGSGHVEPLGVLLVLLTVLALADRRPGRAAVALAGAVLAKLLPLALLPGVARRVETRWVLAMLALLVLPFLVLGALGPAVGSGLFDYAGRWEGNAVVFPAVRAGLERLDTGPALEPAITALKRRVDREDWPWDRLYRAAWPPTLARLIVGAAAAAWLLLLTFRRGLPPEREVYLGLAGVLLLSPTLHPWYVLWVLPFAAARASPGWLGFAALVPLAYLGSGQPTGWLLGVEYLPLALHAGLLAFRRWS